jgi:hypothetical protein
MYQLKMVVVGRSWDSSFNGWCNVSDVSEIVQMYIKVNHEQLTLACDRNRKQKDTKNPEMVYCL